MSLGYLRVMIAVLRPTIVLNRAERKGRVNVR